MEQKAKLRQIFVLNLSERQMLQIRESERDQMQDSPQLQSINEALTSLVNSALGDGPYIPHQRETAMFGQIESHLQSLVKNIIPRLAANSVTTDPVIYHRLLSPVELPEMARGREQKKISQLLRLTFFFASCKHFLDTAMVHHAKTDGSSHASMGVHIRLWMNLYKFSHVSNGG